MISSTIVVAICILASKISAYVLLDHGDVNDTSRSLRLARRAGPNPADFGWIKRWAAIGDSFTAGIGSGNLYSRRDEDYECSRYDHSYPALANNKFGPAVEDFQYIACSGDRSVQIYDQISALKGGLDLVMMTAGGNDLCLVRPYHALSLNASLLTEHFLSRLV